MVKSIIKPEDFVTTPSVTLDFDYDKIAKKYETKPEKFLYVVDWKQEKSRLQIIINGELSTNGIAVNEFLNNGKKVANYSLGIRLEDAAIESIQLLNVKLASYFPPNFEFTDSLKDDIIYLKLKPQPDRKSFGVISNVKLDPKKIGETPISAGTTVSITCDVSAYVNLNDYKAGIVYKIAEINFEDF